MLLELLPSSKAGLPGAPSTRRATGPALTRKTWSRRAARPLRAPGQVGWRESGTLLLLLAISGSSLRAGLCALRC